MPVESGLQSMRRHRATVPAGHGAVCMSCTTAAQGACEMLFNPLKFWLTKGPFNKVCL